MKPYIFGMIAVTLYGISNVVLEQKFSKLNSLTLLFCQVTITLVLISAFYLTIRKSTNNPTLALPTGTNIWIWIISFSAIVCCANLAFIGSFTSGGRAITISLLLLLCPVVAAITDAIWTGRPPTRWHIVSYILAALAVASTIKGNTTR